MATVHSIAGLIAWARRDEWRDQFEDVLDRHNGAAFRGAGIDVDGLADVIGDGCVSNLWGFAFEVFVSSASDERNVAVDFLKRRGWKESPGTRTYIQALRQSTISLYEISDIIVGECFLAHDLVRGMDLPPSDEAICRTWWGTVAIGDVGPGRNGAQKPRDAVHH